MLQQQYLAELGHKRQAGLKRWMVTFVNGVRGLPLSCHRCSRGPHLGQTCRDQRR